MLTRDDFKDSKIDKRNGDPLHWLAELMSVLGETVELEKRKLEEEKKEDGESEVLIEEEEDGEWEVLKEEEEEDGEWEVLIEEEEEDGEWEVSILKRKRSKRQRPVCCPPPYMVKDLSRPIVEIKLQKRKLKEKEDGEWEGLKPKPKPRRSSKPRPVCRIPPPDLPENIRRHIYETMGGSGLILVIQKAMFFSDVNPSASRFSMPFSQLSTHDFLNETEAAALDDQENQNTMKVSLLDPLMIETTLNFNKWTMNNTSLYVMTKGWNSVVTNNGLEEHDIVQLWSFRVNSKLCFALVKL